MAELLLMQLNALDLYAPGDPSEAERWERVHELVRRHRPAVLALQELISRGEDGVGDAAGASRRVAQLADAVGMNCVANPGDIAPAHSVAVADTGYHTALLWQDGVSPVPGSWRSRGRRGGLWHSIAAIRLDFGGPTLGFASFHWSPFSSVMRAQEAPALVAVMTSLGACLAAGDANQIGSDVIVGPDGRRRFYDEDTMNRSVPNIAYHAVPSGDPLQGGQLVADRRPAQLVRAAGMVDAAVRLDAPWQPTVGHWAAKPGLGPRRIDQVLASPAAAPTLRSYAVDDSDAAKAASDHLPVLVGFDPAAAE
jgi:endonuclease/exonuclease/phosphatase family metal-dependent hydrolase